MTERIGFDPQILTKSYREKVILPKDREIFLARIPLSDVEGSSNSYINCNGYGMVRRSTTERSEWPKIDILPNLVPQKLDIDILDAENTQIFRIGACNYRCWYCFVDYRYLKASPEYGDYMSVDKMLDLYQEEKNPPKIIYLTGGQPDIAPEWTLWTMEALKKRGLSDKTFLWQDDNLSSMSLWDELDNEQIMKMVNYSNSARATCLKGISPETFTLNTGAKEDYFNTQIEILSKLVNAGFDVYTYLTLLSPDIDHAKSSIPILIDRLRSEVHPNMPLRVFPSKVVEFPETVKRLNDEKRAALKNQNRLLEIWQNELANQYNSEDMSVHPVNVTLN